jgi:hypothetical protein
VRVPRSAPGQQLAGIDTVAFPFLPLELYLGAVRGLC